jgi:serine palmitoyltransferase
MERKSQSNDGVMHTTGSSTRCLNLGSYNYLGFADDWKKTCRDDVMRSVNYWPNSMCSSRASFGTSHIHDDLEKTVARFVGKEAAVVFTMGYGTNATTIPILMAGDGSLIISDSLNHTSIINGARASPSPIRVFKHNNPKHLEEILKEAIIKGQPKHHRPWKKILVMVEGIYSMEGAICNLSEIVRICKRYKAYLYVDEAHSIGALGKTGRGVCEHCGVDPADIGTLYLITKSNNFIFVSFIPDRHPDGHIHEEFQRDGRLHRRVEGDHRLHQVAFCRSDSPQLVVSGGDATDLDCFQGDNG